MIDLYTWPTPNGRKVHLVLEELSLDYRVIPVDIGKGDQRNPTFLALNANGKIPVAVDRRNAVHASGGKVLVESCAILLHLSETAGRFFPKDRHGTPMRQEALEWLFFQAAHVGPMLGQNHHFRHYAPETLPYAIDRYTAETQRLYKVLNERLSDREWILGDEYSIVDMAIYPWIASHTLQDMDLQSFAALEVWFSRIAQRPATVRAWKVLEDKRNRGPLTVSEENRKHLFPGQ